MWSTLASIVSRSIARPSLGLANSASSRVADPRWLGDGTAFDATIFERGVQRLPSPFYPRDADVGLKTRCDARLKLGVSRCRSQAP